MKKPYSSDWEMDEADELDPGESILDGNDLVSTPYLPPAVPLPAPVGANMPGSAEALIRLLSNRKRGY